LDPRLAAQAGLICPRCRHAGTEGIIQSSLDIERVLNTDREFIVEGFLACSNERCPAVYPILAGVPIILKDMRGWWQSAKAGLSGALCDSPELGGYFSGMDAESPGAFEDRSTLSSYLDLHYGAEPGTAPALGMGTKSFWEAFLSLLPQDGQTRFSRAIDLGCSVGRGTFELARVSELAVGIDSNFDAVSRAARFQRTGEVQYERRRRGRCFEQRTSPFRPASNALFLVADALDPPFAAESFDCVAALNLIDSIRIPLILLGQMDALLRNGGDLLLCTAYAWRSDVTDPMEWLETDALDGPDMLRHILAGEAFPRMRFGYEIAREIPDVPWRLRNHDRYTSEFLTEFLLARKRAPA
jgi:SAM-dependent methyltransferase/uncharacterized protein YbaR (Trm112 family)